jgi:Putative adhesin
LIAFLVVLFLCAGLALVGTLLGFGLGVGGAMRNSSVQLARTFPVSGSPAALILTSDAGSVTINSGDPNSMVVQATKYAGFGGNFNDVQITYAPNGNTVNVSVHRSGTFNFFNSTSVDFTITAPPTTNLTITTNAGSINVSGITGKMLLNSNAGSIAATQATLTDSSTFRTNAGSINFNGSIGSTGTYDFETNAGSVDMTLPGTASFHLNATTDVGTINTSFPVTVSHSGAGASAKVDVGPVPQATLTLRTNAGSISLNKS